MARDFNAKNIIVGAAVVYVGNNDGVENNKINVSSSTVTAQDPQNISTVTNG